MDEQTTSQLRKDKFTKLAIHLLIVFGLLGIGGGVLAYLINTKPGPSGEKDKSQGRLVHVFRAERTSHRIASDTYGTTRASEVWAAIAEVRGRAVQVSEQFEPGEILPADSLLVRIDPTDYELAVTRLKAEVRARNEQLRELDQNEANLKEIYKLQHRQLKLAADAYQRQRQVFAKHAASRSAMEISEDAYVSRLTAAQQTRNSLALMPVKRDLLRASLEVAQSQLEQAKRDLDECVIRLPMPGRCASKSVEQNQYVTVGERLGTFLSLDMTEVVAMVETRKMAALFSGGIEELGVFDFTAMNHSQSIWERVEVPAEVHWSLGDRSAVWHGRVARLGSSLDPGTRTIPVIIEVPDPYKNVKPGIRPPLVPDVFCEVTLYGTTVDDVVLIPRDALHNGSVYLLRNGKLHIQPVTVLVLEDSAGVISEGIDTGDEVILTDLFPASEGMALRGKVAPNPVGAKPQAADNAKPQAAGEAKP